VYKQTQKRSEKRLSRYKYRYNSKEYQDELGLNVYDYGARTYMPDIGRFAVVEPTGTRLSATLVLACSEYLHKLKDKL